MAQQHAQHGLSREALQATITDIERHRESLKAFLEQSLNEELQHAGDEDEVTTSTFGEQIADKVAAFGGSWKFIIIFSILLAAWIIWNQLLPKERQFDPFPFILMNLILSCIAAMQAPIIMMSQNRQEEKDRRRAKNDYLVNLKAEIEIRKLHEKLDMLIAEELTALRKAQEEQLHLLQQLSGKG